MSAVLVYCKWTLNQDDDDDDDDANKKLFRVDKQRKMTAAAVELNTLNDLKDV